MVDKSPNGSERVVIFDTTLRDGEQSPGASMTLEQKLRVALALQQLKVDVIEAGFPAASPGDFEAVRTIAKKLKGVSVCGLARAQRGGHRPRLGGGPRSRRSRASTSSSRPVPSTASSSCR